MPKLVRLYILETLVGFALSAVFVGALLYLNVGNLWHLISTSSSGVLALFLLWLFNGIVFSGVQFGITITRMADTSGDNDGGKRDDLRVRDHAPVPVRIAPAHHDRR